MQVHRIEVVPVKHPANPLLPNGWELFIDGHFAGRGPESSRDIMEEMAMLHVMVAAKPDIPEETNGR